MKVIFCSIILVMTVLSKTIGQQYLYTVTGTAPSHLDGKMVMKFTFKDKKVNAVDTTLISNGSFHFQSDQVSDGFSIITTGSYPDTVRSVRFIAEPGNIVIHLDTFSQTGGSPLNIAYQNFLDCDRIRWKLIMKMQNAKIEGLPYAEDEKQFNENEKSCPSLKTFIVENGSNILGRAFFKQKMSHIIDEEFLEIYPVADMQIQSDTDVIKVFKKKKESVVIKREKEQLIGTTYTDFKCYTQ